MKVYRAKIQKMETRDKAVILSSFSLRGTCQSKEQFEHCKVFSTYQQREMGES
jgi:hypothetical protein